MSRVSSRNAGDGLDQTIAAFTADLQRRFSLPLARRPAAFRRRVLRLVNQHLSPACRRSGRPRSAQVDFACAAYFQQQREIAGGTRARLDWPVIASAADPGFDRITNLYRRRVRLAQIRAAVGARVRADQDVARSAPRKALRS